ncbi:MAG: amidohydrolase, partial [Lachnospiraceae bacterium]|nr:amidohydrolase [Lachnospiraceae bacterium]
MIKPYIEEQRDKLISLRRYFHRYPEVSMKEYRTAEKIEEELDNLHIFHKRVGETGVLGIIGTGEPDGKTLVLRADIDALALQDKKSEEYASANEGVMHACGHDAHTTALLGAAAVLKEKEKELKGQVRLFFQQGEEFGQGAGVFLKEGLLEGADRVFGIHVASNIPVGNVGLSAGPVNASVDHFVINVEGKSAHVSTPHLGIDALYIAAQIVNALQGIVSRQTDPADTVVVGIGVLRAGDAYNIIAGNAKIEGTTRCFTVKTREETNRRIERIARSIGETYGAEVSVEFEDFASPLINDRQVCEEVRQIAADIVGEEHIVPRERSLGGDDFAEYLLKVPGAYAYVGTGNQEKQNTVLPQHADRYDIDEEGVLIGANLYADYALQ